MSVWSRHRTQRRKDFERMVVGCAADGNPVELHRTHGWRYLTWKKFDGAEMDMMWDSGSDIYWLELAAAPGHPATTMHMRRTHGFPWPIIMRVQAPHAAITREVVEGIMCRLVTVGTQQGTKMRAVRARWSHGKGGRRSR